MRKSSLYLSVGILAALVAGLYSCTRFNGINNNQVVETPFSLYFTDTGGAMYNSNNGKNITKVVFNPDGKPSRSIVVSGTNLLWAKDSLYYSSNSGVNFNHTFDTVGHQTDANCTGKTVDRNRNMLYDFPAWHRVYVTSSATFGPTLGNYFGLAFNDQNGLPLHWAYDGTYDTTSPERPGNMGILPVKAISMTQMANGVGTFIAFHYDFPLDTFTIRVMWGVFDQGYVRWNESTANPTFISGVGGSNLSGTPLPSGPGALLPHYTLGHLNNRLIVVDATCNYGAYYSDDTGRNWIAYPGVPASTPLLCIASPFEQVCLVGTYGKGLYILNLHTNMFEPNNNGLASNLIVRDICAKENVFKNGNKQRYIYIATNQGIFQSTDGGINWTLVIEGNYVNIY